MYLVDTNVLSAGAPPRANLLPELAGWMERNSALLYVSVITVAEVVDGIAKLRRTGVAGKAGRLADWLDTLLHLYGERVLPLDLAAAQCLGGLSDQARATGQAPGLADLAIAATAATRGYTVLTRNMRHFRMLSVPAHDPFESLPVAHG